MIVEDIGKLCFNGGVPASVQHQVGGLPDQTGRIYSQRESIFSTRSGFFFIPEILQFKSNVAGLCR